MQQHIYTARKGRIFRQSLLIWKFVFAQIVINIIAGPLLCQAGQKWSVLFINLILSAITIPSLILFTKYYRYSIGKSFIVTYESLKIIDMKNGKTTELINSDINKIGLVENKRTSRLPWMFHNYFYFTDLRNNKIILTSYFMDISEFWLDTLTRKIDSNNFVREEKTLPLFNL